MNKQETEMEERKFSLLENMQEIEDIPSRLLFGDEKRHREMVEFFGKIPVEKAMQVKFPNEKIWRLYNQRLRYYAGLYSHNLSIHARKTESGYFIYLKRKKEEE